MRRTHDPSYRYRAHQPAEKKLTERNLRDAAAGTSDAFFNLIADPCLDTADDLLFRLDGATASVRCYRASMIDTDDPGLVRD